MNLKAALSDTGRYCEAQGQSGGKAGFPHLLFPVPGFDSPVFHKPIKTRQTKGLPIFAVEGKKRLAAGAGAKANQIFRAVKKIAPTGSNRSRGLSGVGVAVSLAEAILVALPGILGTRRVGRQVISSVLDVMRLLAACLWVQLPPFPVWVYSSPPKSL